VHHLQGKTESVTPSDLHELIREFCLERLGLLLRHESAARFVSDYDINNAYQNIIAREETQISWLQQALIGAGRELPPDPSRPEITPARKGRDAVLELAAEDARANTAFVTKWRPRVDAVTNARHKGMLGVILGEMLEHARLFEQAAAGRTDVIGKALPINPRTGSVLHTRWLE
jgi:hypothetical protein